MIETCTCSRVRLIASLLPASRAFWPPHLRVIGQGARTYPTARTGGNYMHNYYLPPAPSSTPWAPAWSPDGNWIAVAMSGSIWKVDPASGVAHELTYDGKYHSMPDWSPDGKWIVYTADDGGTTIQLAIVNVVSGETRTLTNDEFHLHRSGVFARRHQDRVRVDEAERLLQRVRSPHQGRPMGGRRDRRLAR